MAAASEVMGSALVRVVPMRASALLMVLNHVTGQRDFGDEGRKSGAL